MSWQPDLKWCSEVLSSVVNVHDQSPQAVGHRDPLNVHLATRFALGVLEVELAKKTEQHVRPVVTTLCGSSRFPEVHASVMMHLTMLGRVVVPMGCYGHADYPTGARFLTSDGDEATPEKRALDQLHFRKIEMSDGIFVVNPGDYVGSSTLREVAHAKKLGKTVEWLFPTRHET